MHKLLKINNSNEKDCVFCNYTNDCFEQLLFLNCEPHTYYVDIRKERRTRRTRRTKTKTNTTK